MRYGSICSGIEAATVAWHPLGWEPVFFSEIDPAPCAVLQHHYPTVPLHGDFTTMYGDEYGSINLLVGGTPCQSFSVAGLREGLGDERGNLALEFIKIARRARAQWVVWENVPGVLSSWSDDEEGIDRNAFACFLAGLAECGYGFAYRIFDAQYFGLAQRRQRVFVVAYLGDWRPPAAVLFERESMRRNTPPSRKTGQRVAPTVEGRAGRSGANSFSTSGGLAADVAPTISARTKGGGGLGTDFDLDGGLIAKSLRARHCSSGREDSDTFIAHTLRGEGFDASEDGSGRGIPLVPEIAWALQARDAKGADSNTKEGHLIPHVTIPINTQVATRHNAMGERTGMGIGGEDDPAFTLGANHSHAIASFKPGQSADSRSIGYDENVAPSLEGGEGGNSIPAVACFDERNVTSKTNRSKVEYGSPANTMHESPLSIISPYSVRRLTPVECERLQGLPDNYTLVPYRKRLMSDSQRYKMIGNSMPTTVMKWIGSRIDMVQGVLNDIRTS